MAISLRVTRRAGDLLGQPLFYTEVHFQGDQKDVKDPEEDAASAAP